MRSINVGNTNTPSTLTPSDSVCSLDVDNPDDNVNNLGKAYEISTAKLVRSFLERTVAGQFILNSYRKQNSLNRNLRNQLTYLVVNGLMSDKRYIFFII